MGSDILDILNEKWELTGESRTFSDAHKLGLRHRSVHVWIINSNNQLLLQKRVMDHQAYPGYWDISAAGHVETGGTSLEAAKSETSEEIGLILPDSVFKLIFSLEEHKVLNEGNYISNEIQDVYLVHVDKDLTEIRPDKKEVSDLQWVTVEKFKLLIKNKKFKLVPHEEEYRRLLEFIEE